MNSKLTGCGGVDAAVKKIIAIFNFKHENKSCAACPEGQLKAF